MTAASAIALDLGAGSGRVATVTCRAGRLDLAEAHHVLLDGEQRSLDSI